MAEESLAPKTPGVYIVDVEQPPSVIGVATAVPAFVGYTETAVLDGNSVSMQAVPVRSLAEFEAAFGGAPKPEFELPEAGAPAASATDDSELQVSGNFHLYNSMRLFFANGGDSCYVVSVGSYREPERFRPVRATDLTRGLTVLASLAGVTMLVVPDAVLLPSLSEFSSVAHAMLSQCATLMDRIAILDVFGAETVPEIKGAKEMAKVIEVFQCSIGEVGLSYAASYFPNLNTTLLQNSDVDVSRFTQGELSTVHTEPGQALLRRLNVLPPSGAMAGIITLSDRTRGVWNAPANMSVALVESPTVWIGDEEQGSLLFPVNGMAVNAIRSFAGRGPVVWSARTMDGNSGDWSRLEARRTILYLEQSIKSALQPFVFAPNDAQTWAMVTDMISRFLNSVWAQGGLMGDKASDAYTVACGLGSTMTADDILGGSMVVSVTLQMLRPAEYVALEFRQAMEGTT